MRRTPASLFAFAASLLLALPAHALVMPPIPTGSCALDTNQQADRNATNYMHLSTQVKGTLKALFAECRDLERMRSGRTVFVSTYGAVFEQESTLPEGITRQQAIAIVADASGLSGAIATRSVNGTALANQNRENGPQLSASTHSILRQGENLLVLGSEQRHVGSRQQYTVGAVTAITVVKGKFVTMNFYAPLNDAQVMERLATSAETYAASLLAANP